MSALRTVGARLSVALVVVLAVALGVVYTLVVPPLERNLVEAKLDQLESAASLLAQQFAGSPALDPAFELSSDVVADAAVTANARVVLFTAADGSLTVVDDSRQSASSGDVAGDEIAHRAAQTLALERGIVERDGQRLAEVAVPISFAITTQIVLFTASLDDTLANVAVVKRRLLAAGAAAMLVALALGYGGASAFARRIRRLERAAERIASGRLDEPVVDGGADELGQLAAAFERMRQRLAQLERARREFVANASHELRTPIFSLGGFLELLANEDLDDETRREFMTTMQEQVERLTKLTEDLLDLSRLDAGRLHVEQERVDLRQLADLLADEFSVVAAATGHELAVAPDGGRPGALGDEQRVLQVGRILVENALRHTEPGTPVRIAVGRQDGRAVLSVADEGGGIPAAHAEHVFERFYRVDGGRASGSGLGLAIARELAEVMGGTLELSPAGRGAVFTLSLPSAPSPAREQPPALARR